MRGRRTSPDTGVDSFVGSGGGGGSSDAGESSRRGGGGDLVLVDWVVGSCSGDGEVLEDWNAGSGSLTSRTSSEVSVERLLSSPVSVNFGFAVWRSSSSCSEIKRIGGNFDSPSKKQIFQHTDLCQ